VYNPGEINLTINFMPALYKTTQPVWKFWTKMTRELTDEKGAAKGTLKATLGRSLVLLDEGGKELIVGKPRLGVGYSQELMDANGESLGLLRKKPVDNRGKMTGSTKLYVIEKDGKTEMFIQTRKYKDVAPRLIKSEANLRDRGKYVWEIVGSKPLALIIHNSGGMQDEWNLVFEEGVSKSDSLLCLMLFGYKLHNLLK